MLITTVVSLKKGAGKSEVLYSFVYDFMSHEGIICTWACILQNMSLSINQSYSFRKSKIISDDTQSRNTALLSNKQ